MSMKEQKQLDLLTCFDCGKYRINETLNGIESRVGGNWRPLCPNPLPNGYKQIIMFGGRRTGIKVQVYEHIAVYIGMNGVYPEGMQIDHRDKNTSNSHIDNLRLCSPAENVSYRKNKSRKAAETRPIRSEEIANIKLLMQEGKSQAAIARELDLNRLSVRYIMKQIESGQPLKYEKTTAKRPATRAKRTEQDKIKLVKLWQAGLTVAEIAKQSNCSRQNVYIILENRGFNLGGKRKTA